MLIKSKIIILALLLILFSVNKVESQTTGIPFAPDNTRWSMETQYMSCLGCYNYFWTNIRIKGDTIINNKFCQKLFVSYNHDFDTICLHYSNYAYYFNRKLYIDTTLLYDFNLNVGDTFNLHFQASNNPCVPNQNGYLKMPVDSVDSVYFGNIWRKRITFKQIPNINFGPIKWVEGIGDIVYGFTLTPVYFYSNVSFFKCLSGWSKLNCFQEPGYASWGNYCFNGSCSVNTDLINENKSISIYLNPTYNKLYINGLNQRNSISVFIYNSIGELLKNANNITEIDVSDLPPGMYILKLTGKEFLIAKRFIIQK